MMQIWNILVNLQSIPFILHGITAQLHPAVKGIEGLKKSFLLLANFHHCLCKNSVRKRNDLKGPNFHDL